MNLGEYVGSGSGTTRLLLHLDGDATDSSGNGNNGTGTNINYYNIYGILGKYAAFNGYSAYMRVPDHSSLNIRDDIITVSAWFMTNDNTSGTTIVSKRGQYLLYIDMGSGLLSFDISIPYGILSTTDTEVCQTGVWKYATGVYDGINSKLYVNGVLKKERVANGQLSDPDPKSDLGIGASINLTTVLTSSLFKGYIDEVIIESRAWSHSEIKKYYTNSLGRYGAI